MATPIRITRTTGDVLGVLLDGVDSDEDLYGLEICRRTGLGTGTVYPILSRLQRVGWVQTHWEDEAQWQTPEGGQTRPRRRLYTLTGQGRVEATQALAARARRTFFGRAPREGWA